MSAHTPAPWIVGHNLQNSIVTDTFQHGEWAVADVNIVRAEAAANARLIAAAPDLLAFVKEWLNLQGSDENYMTAKARAAIFKATGEAK